MSIDQNNLYILTGLGIANFASNAMLKRKYRDAKQLTTNYGKTFPKSKIPYGSSVIIANFNYSESILKELKDLYNLLIITNNSETSEIVQRLEIANITDESSTAVAVVWNYCFPELPIPNTVLRIADWDEWEFELEETKSFIMGTNLLNLYPSDKSMYLWNSLLNDDEELVNDTTMKGTLISNYCNERDALILNDLGFELEIDGYKCLVANSRNSSSLFFDSKKNDGYDAFILYGWIPNIYKFRCTVFANDNKDITPILRAYNGGGRPGVGGFTMDTKFHIDIKEGEDCYIDHLYDLYTKSITNNTVWAYNGKHDLIGINSQLHKGYLFDHMCAFSNTPYTWNTIWHNVNTTGCALGIGYVYTNTGKTRLVISNLTNVDLDDLAKKIDGIVVNNSVWKYLMPGSKDHPCLVN